MAEKQQSAVDWLLDKLHYLHSTKWDDITQQARLLFEEQIKNAWMDGGSTLSAKNAVKYYDNTFKSE